MQAGNPPADTARVAELVVLNRGASAQLAYAVTSTRSEPAGSYDVSVTYVSMAGVVVSRSPLTSSSG